jgi:tRNA uridine 5-carboxymethylaminomethyl modification enzyme
VRYSQLVQLVCHVEDQLRAHHTSNEDGSLNQEVQRKDRTRGEDAMHHLPTGLPDLDEMVAEEVELQVKYEHYVRKQEQSVHRTQRLEEYRIPETIDYQDVRHLRTQARQKLSLTRPRTIGQASRVEGVTPADIAILMIYVEKMRATHVRT